MRKIAILFLLAIGFGLCSCEEQKTENELPKYDNSMFVCVEQGSSWKVVYHRETGVMYVVSAGYYNSGTFTMLCDTTGKPLVWKGSKE